MPPTGGKPNRASGSIYFSLRQHEKKIRKGRSFTDNIGFKVNLPNRKSFSPDVAFYICESAGMKFVEGAPVFAVEVRSEGDYGAKAEQQIRKKTRGLFCSGNFSGLGC
jgi:Uma2 family endonuclease